MEKKTAEAVCFQCGDLQESMLWSPSTFRLTFQGFRFQNLRSKHSPGALDTYVKHFYTNNQETYFMQPVWAARGSVQQHILSEPSSIKQSSRQSSI